MEYWQNFEIHAKFRLNNMENWNEKIKWKKIQCFHWITRKVTPKASNSHWITWRVNKKLKKMQNSQWISWKITPNMPSKDVWKFTPVSYRTLALWGRCPAFTPLLQLSLHAGHRVPLTMCNPWMTCCVCVCVGWGVGCGWVLAAPAHPSATILWPLVTCSAERERKRESVFFLPIFATFGHYLCLVFTPFQSPPLLSVFAFSIPD